jgi:hypothetical protein
MKKVLLVWIMMFFLVVASGVAQTQDMLKPNVDSTAAGDSLAKKAYVLCPNCGRANLPEANYCIYCGAPLKPGLVRKQEVRVIEGSVERDDPSYTRLFIAPTGETLEQGTGYFGDSEIFLLQGGYGLADVLTLFGGSTLIPGNLDWQVVLAGPKVRLVKTGNFAAAAGVVGAFNPHLNVVPWVAYGVATLGKTTGRLNLGIGKVGNGTGSSTPWLFSLGGEAGHSNRSRWLWESWIWQYENTEYSNLYIYPPPPPTIKKEIAFPTCLGLRFFGENISGDLGLVYYWSSEGGAGTQVGFPLVNVVYHFK